MKRLIFILCALFACTTASAESTRLLSYHGEEIETPFWFKDSFLDLAEDATEANDEGKRLMLYFHQAGCPYCFNMVQQNFLDPRLSSFIQEKFDVVALDLWGDREVTLPDGTTLSEKQLAQQWKIQYTPTLIFLTPEADIQLRIDGYRPKPVFSRILDYVLSGKEEGGLAHTLIQRSDAVLYPQPFFNDTRDLSTTQGKLTAVFLEYPGCSDCEDLHKHALAKSAVFDQLKPFTAVRFDATSKEKITLVDGSVSTPEDWVKTLGVNYYPTLILLDETGKERFRVGGYVQSFHLATALEYVSSRGYEKFPEFQRFLNDRADRLRASGTKVVITE